MFLHLTMGCKPPILLSGDFLPSVFLSFPLLGRGAGSEAPPAQNVMTPPSVPCISCAASVASLPASSAFSLMLFKVLLSRR